MTYVNENKNLQHKGIDTNKIQFILMNFNNDTITLSYTINKSKY